MKASSLLLLIGLGTWILSRKSRRRQHEAESFAGKVVLITGGSRGFGLAMAREFAKQGAKLALLARNEPELDRAVVELRGGGMEVLPLPADVRDPGAATWAIQKVLQHYARLDVLVNNAGIIIVGPLQNMNIADYEDAMATHLWGPLRFMQKAVPYLRQTQGRIVNISSIGGKIAVPHLAPYSVSKFALSGLSDSFRAELFQEGVSVTTVVPGLLRSGSHVQAIFKGQYEKEFDWFALGAATPITSVAVERAASQVVEACLERRTELTIGWQAKLAILAHALFPRLTATNAAHITKWMPEAVASGFEREKGADVRAVLPKWTTALIDEAGQRHNERGDLPPPSL